MLSDAEPTTSAKTISVCEIRRVSLPVCAAKIPKEDCQEKLSVLLVMKDGLKLLILTQSNGSDGECGGHREDARMLL